MRLVTLLLDDSGGGLDYKATVVGGDGRALGIGEGHFSFENAIAEALKDAGITNSEGELTRV